jgi:hypothetical protein
MPEGLRYDRAPLRRFLLFAIPLLIVTMGLFQFALEMFHLQVDPGALGGGSDLPGGVRLATWALEALALSALFVLIHGHGWGSVSGLLTGWIAWVFRGPLLVLAVAGYGGMPPHPWWALAFRWWVLYSLCGLLLGVIASLTRLSEDGRVVHEPFRYDQPEPEPPESAPTDPDEPAT